MNVDRLNVCVLTVHWPGILQRERERERNRERERGGGMKDEKKDEMGYY